MAEEQGMSNSLDTRSFNSNITDIIGYLFNLTSFCQTDLNTKLTLKTPGRTYTKLRTFKFNFDYLFTLSSKRKEINTGLKDNIRVWLDMDVPFSSAGNIDTDYIRAGMKLFLLYGDELYKIGMVTYKR